MKMIRFVGIMLLFLTTLQLSAQDRPMVLVTEYWPPFRIENPDAPWNVAGIDADVIALIEAETGIRIEIQRHPFARCLEMMRDGRGDAISGIAFTPERAEFIEYVPTSYFSVRPVFVARRGLGAEILSYDDLYGRRIGYSLNSAYFEPFNSDSRLEKVGISTEEQLLQMVALGRVDLIVGTDPNISWDLKRLGLSSSVDRPPWAPDIETQLFFGFSKKSEYRERVAEIDQVIRRIRDDGSLAGIAQKYR